MTVVDKRIRCPYCKALCDFEHESSDDCGWCPECHPEVPEWT